ncbi:MAG: type II toxin-antitoxin system PemK/MazF family toxin, partial [Patescibacteria group bacterium]
KIATVTIVPITSNIKNFPSSIIIKASSKNNLKQDSRIELSQIRTIDRTRIIKKIGALDDFIKKELCDKLILFFDLGDEF